MNYTKSSGISLLVWYKIWSWGNGTVWAQKITQEKSAMLTKIFELHHLFVIPNYAEILILHIIYIIPKLITANSSQMRENTDQKNSVFEHILHSELLLE